MDQENKITDPKFEMFFNLSPDLMCVISGEGYFLELNPAWEETLGYSLAELKSRHYSSFMVPEDIAKTEKEFAEELKGKDVINFVNRYICRDGKIKWLEWCGKATADKTKAYAVARDVTEKMLLQETRLKQANTIMQIYELLPFYFNIIDKNQVYTYANSKCEAFYGKNIHEIIGKKVIQVVGKETYKTCLPYFLKALEGEKTAFETIVPGVGGKSHYLHNIFHPYYENDEIAGVISMISDITQTKLAEREIKNQAELINLAPDSIIERDLDSRIIFWNRGAEKKYGFSLEEVRGKISFELFKTEFPEPFEDIKAHLNQHNYWEGELIQTCKNGNQIVVLSRMQLKRDENRMPVSVLEINTDITRRKEAEANLKNMEARFHSSFELPSIGIAITSPEKKWLEVNAALLTMLGYSRAELEQTTWADLTHPDDLNYDIEHFNRVLAGELETYSIEKRFIKKNGEILWTIMSAGCVRKTDGAIDYFVAKLQDINRLKQTEEMLLHRSIELRTLIDNLPDTIYFKDIDGRKIIANQADVTLMGYKSESEVLGKTDLELFNDEIGLRGYQDDMTVIKQDKTIVHEEAFTDPSGNEVMLLTTKVPLHDEHGNVIGLVGLGFNITELKKAQLQLQRQTDELKEINADKDKLFSIVAHDLRSPFNAFLNLTQLLNDEVMTADRGEIQNMTSALAESAQKVYRLLENLLEWSLMQRGMMNPNPEWINLNEKICHYLENIEEIASSKKIEVKYQIPENVVVFADEKMLNGTVRNLLSNAVKFTPKGGLVTLTASVISEKEVEVSVRDSGIGMNRELTTLLFKTGANTGRPGTEGEPSSGLGLMLCKEFVEKNGGRIWVESKPGGGSTFYFTLPKYIPKTNDIFNAEKTANTKDDNKPGLKILIAEDDLASRLYLLQVLKKYSSEIFQATSGAQAIEICQSHPDLDLVLMDILMPGIDGYEAIRSIRKFNKTVVIIVQSTLIQIDGTQKALEAGCNDVVAKPIQFEKLKNLLAKYFEVS
mgnify:FL=1